MANVLTVREAVQRAKAEDYPITEYSLRCWIKMGAIPVRRICNKNLIFYPNLISFLECQNGADNVPAVAELTGIRRVDL